MNKKDEIPQNGLQEAKVKGMVNLPASMEIVSSNKGLRKPNVDNKQ